MADDNKRTSDEFNNDINSGADLASRAISRPNNNINKGNGRVPPGNSGSQGSVPQRQAGGTAGKNQPDKKSDGSLSNINNQGEGGGKNNSGGGIDALPNGANSESATYGGKSGLPPNISNSPSAAQSLNQTSPKEGTPQSASAGSQSKNSATGKSSGNDSANGMSETGIGSSTSSSGAKAGGGGQAASAGGNANTGGTAGSTGGATSGSAVSTTGAGAGTAASAGGGAAAGATTGSAAAGATAGSAAGPVGTAAGAVAGAVIPTLIKLIIKVLVCLLFIICVFNMHPSTLYDFPQAIVEREALESTYNAYYESIEDEYRKDIQSAKGKARSASSGYNTTMKNNPNTALDGRVSLSDYDLAKVLDLLNDSDIDRIVYASPVTMFSIGDSELLESMCGNINMVISLLDVKKNHWFIQLAKWVLNSLTGGWISKFTEGVSRWWEGLWNDFVIHQLSAVGAEVWIEEIMDDEEPEEVKEIVGHIKYTFTYDLRDLGVGFYTEKLDLNMDEVNKAAEMSQYLGDLFGNLNEYYTGWYVEPGDWTDPVSGGSTGERIVYEISLLESEPVFNDTVQTFPLQGYTNPRPSSWFGPRNFALDPFHSGIDFSAPRGTPILAIQDGVVLYTAYQSGGFGRHIVIYHGNNVATLYAHMQSFGSFNKGDTVKSGDVIGYVGSTGLSTGPHLHFQLNIGSQAYNPIGHFRVFDYLK